jgi:hypothetical protein
MPFFCPQLILSADIQNGPVDGILSGSAACAVPVARNSAAIPDRRVFFIVATEQLASPYTPHSVFDIRIGPDT